MKKYGVLLFASMFAFASCEDILESDGDLSTADIVKGLKTALNVGTDSSTAMLSLKNGYYGDPTVKIPLPDEAEKIMAGMEYIERFAPSAASLIKGKMDDLVLAINRSAESAAADAKPIFTEAITDLTIVDGLEILNGSVPSSLKSDATFDSTAATKYLKIKTYNSLFGAYAPKINGALDQKLVGNASATSLWNDVTSNYNGFVEQYGSKARAAVEAAELITGKKIDLQFNEVNTDIGEFTTEKALDGLFLKVGNQEKEIRKNPFQWASEILQKVFGSVAGMLAD